MSWIEKLYETYEACAGNEAIPDAEDLCPVGYSTQNAHIEVVIDGQGNYLRAALIEKENNPKTMIPVTEDSAGRTSGEAPHPLCDSVQYCAGDYSEYGGKRKSYYSGYLLQLRNWASSSQYSHPKVKAVYEYVQKGILVQDLVKQDLIAAPDKVLRVIEKNDANKDDVPPIFKLLTFDDKGTKDQAKVFIRWIVESEGDLCTQTWKDKSLQDSWLKYLESFESKPGFCYVTGEQVATAQKHPAKLRNGKDGAKLISSNDSSGYTFLGRFLAADQAAGVSSEVTQKAHSTLRWLIGRKQAFRSGDQVFVSWSVKGKTIPDPWSCSLDFLADIGGSAFENTIIGDAGQSFALRLKRKMAGYKASLNDTENIIVMGLDSATPGRMAITFYRELTGSEFLKRIEIWHSEFAWFQKYSKDIQFVGAPAPRDIAHAVYGTKVDGKNGTTLLNATVERLIPCIIDSAKLPHDLVMSAVQRASNRVGLKAWEWAKCLGIACSLYKGYFKERGYQMALEENRKTRDYLYGRLLAVAERIESMALFYAKEKRETMAARLMQRFADRPFSTWRTIEPGLAPYKARINARTPGLLTGFMEILDKVLCTFDTNDFLKDERLSGEYLIGYHCQRSWLREHKREKGTWVLKKPEEQQIEETEIEIE
jgi:CRISPR-associated protein Csd1